MLFETAWINTPHLLFLRCRSHRTTNTCMHMCHAMVYIWIWHHILPQVAEYIDLLQLDVARNKKYRMDAEVGRWCTGDAEGHVCHSEGGFGWDIIVETLGNLFFSDGELGVPGGVSSGNAGHLGFRNCTYKTTNGKARKMVGESYGGVSWDSGKKPTANWHFMTFYDRLHCY